MTPEPAPRAEAGDQPDKVTLAEPSSSVPEGLDAFYDQTVEWRPCKGSTRDLCGTVTAPVDYDEPRGARVEIALRKVPAGDPAARRGTLFVNPGGPGGSGIEFAKEARTFFSREVRDVWDVVGFDPRGIGESDGFECLRTADLDAMYAADPTPDTTAERAAARAAPAKRLAGCLARGGDLALNMGSEQVARDLDIMRDAVGDTHLNYYGISYGTLIGALYGAQFPDRIGLTVIDSAVDPDSFSSGTPTQEDVDAWAEQDAADVEKAVGDFIDDCVDGGDCALGADRHAAQQRLVGFLEGLDRRPLPSDAEGIPRLTEGWATTALQAVTLYPDSWEPMNDALRVALEDGDGTELVWMAMDNVMRDDDGTYVGGFEAMHLPIHCADWPGDPELEMPVSRSVLEEHPLFAAFNTVRTDTCEGWNGTRRTHLILTIDAKSPVLVIGNEGDLTTPLDTTQRMAKAFFDSRLVMVEAEGHGAYSNGNDCADDLVDDYLVRGLAPRSGQRCTA